MPGTSNDPFAGAGTIYKMNATDQELLRVKDQRYITMLDNNCCTLSFIQQNRRTWRSFTWKCQHHSRTGIGNSATKAIIITNGTESKTFTMNNKHVNINVQLNAYKDQIGQMQSHYNNVSTKVSVLDSETQDKDSLIRALKHERQKYIEEVLQLKFVVIFNYWIHTCVWFRHESLVAAISEKDSYIAMMEMSNENPDKLNHARRQREKMMRRLKEEVVISINCCVWM
jgi:hypothetical protein